MSIDKVLGRGLSALLSDSGKQRAEDKSKKGIIKIDNIEPNRFQPRKVFCEESLTELAESISKHGVIQPIVIRKISNERYEIIVGERRWRASKISGLIDIPVVIVDINDGESLELAIVENIQRRDLNPIEEGESYRRLMSEFGYTQDEVGATVGKGRSYIANLMRILTLPRSIQKMIENKEITIGHAKILVGIKNAEDIAKKIISQDLNVRQVEELVRNMKKNVDKKDEDLKGINHVLDKECEKKINELSQRISANIIADKKQKLTIKYKDLEHLNKILDAIC